MYRCISPLGDLSSFSQSLDQQVLVVMGWGYRANAMRSLAIELGQSIIVAEQPSNDQDYDEWLYRLAKDVHATTKLVGWSLGVQTIHRLGHLGCPFDSAVLINGRCDFVSEAGPGLKLKDFLRFQKRVNRQPDIARSYFAQLCAYGATHEPELEFLQEDLANFSESLAKLNDEIEPFPFVQPVKYLQGARDALVDPEVAKYYKESELYRTGAHDLPVHNARWCASRIAKFWGIQTIQGRIADSFSKSAEHYDKYAKLQQRVADKLLASLPERNLGTVLDLGCGTGYVGRRLAANSEQVVQADLSRSMLSRARFETSLAVQADIQSLPFKSSGFDVVLSSLAMQWCEPNRALFDEIYRVLKPGGYAIVNTLLPGTLASLDEAALRAGLGRRVNTFKAHGIWLDAAELSGFEVHSDTFFAPVEATSFSELMRHLKGVGANCSIERTGGTLTRTDIESWARELSAGSVYQTEYKVLQMRLQKD